MSNKYLVTNTTEAIERLEERLKSMALKSIKAAEGAAGEDTAGVASDVNVDTSCSGVWRLA